MALTVNDFDSAKLDLTTIEEVVNGNAGSDSPVTSRLGQQIKTLAAAIADVQGFTSIVAWQTGVSYNDFSVLVTNGGTTYKLAVAHVSGNFATDLAAGKWLIYFPDSLGTAAILDAQTSLTDATADRLMKVGAFGLGASSTEVGAILDFPLRRGFFRGASGSAANPGGGSSSAVIQATMGLSGRGFQLWSPNVNAGNPAALRMRTFESTDAATAVYGPDQSLYHTHNILGTVSQSGGVPTGAIIQHVPNTGNGEAFLFAGGLAICFHDAFTSADYSNSSGEGGYYTSLGALSWNFPITFVTAPEAMCSVRLSQGGTTRRTANNHTHSSNTASATFTASAGASFDGSNDVSLIAIGRWHN